MNANPLKATLTKKEFYADPSLYSRPGHTLTDNRVLIDCEKAKRTIDISFYKYRGFQCSIWIYSKETGFEFSANGKGATKLAALNATLEMMGIFFNLPLDTGGQTIYNVMHAIADEIGVGEKRFISETWVQDIFPLL